MSGPTSKAPMTGGRSSLRNAIGPTYRDNSVLFKDVDRSEYLKVLGERDERLGRIDNGIRAILDAAAKIKEAGVTPPDSLPAPAPGEFAAIKEEDGDRLAATLLETLGQVKEREKEVDAAMATSVAKDLLVQHQKKINELQFKLAMKWALRAIAVIFVIALLRSCGR